MPFLCLSAMAHAKMNPRDSMPAKRSTSSGEKCADSPSASDSSASGSRRTGPKSLNRIPFLGKSGNSSIQTLQVQQTERKCKRIKIIPYPYDPPRAWPILAAVPAGHIQPAYAGPVSTHCHLAGRIPQAEPLHGASIHAEPGCRPQTTSMIDSDGIHVMRQAWPIWHLRPSGNKASHSCQR